MHVKEQRAFDINYNVETVDEFFDAVRPHYSFLNCYLIVSLALLLSGHIASIAREYTSRTQRFMRESEVVTLRSQLGPFFHSSRSSAEVKVLIILENTWSEQSLYLVEALVKHLFNLTYPDQCQWFRISYGGERRTLSEKESTFKKDNSSEEEIEHIVKHKKLTGIYMYLQDKL